MVTKIKNSLTHRLFYGSTLVLAGCSQAGNKLGMNSDRTLKQEEITIPNRYPRNIIGELADVHGKLIEIIKLTLPPSQSRKKHIQLLPMEVNARNNFNDTLQQQADALWMEILELRKALREQWQTEQWQTQAGGITLLASWKKVDSLISESRERLHLRFTYPEDYIAHDYPNRPLREEQQPAKRRIRKNLSSAQQSTMPSTSDFGFSVSPVPALQQLPRPLFPHCTPMGQYSPLQQQSMLPPQQWMGMPWQQIFQQQPFQQQFTLTQDNSNCFNSSCSSNFSSSQPSPYNSPEASRRHSSISMKDTQIRRSSTPSVTLSLPGPPPPSYDWPPLNEEARLKFLDTNTIRESIGTQQLPHSFGTATVNNHERGGDNTEEDEELEVQLLDNSK